MKRLFILWLLLSPSLAFSGNSDDPAATVIEISGEVFYQGAEDELHAVELGQLFSEGDRLLTKADSSLQLVLADGSTLSLGPNTELSVRSMQKSESVSKTFFELIKGTVNAIVESLSQGSTFEIRSTHGVAAVKGTEFELSADETESSVTVREGVVSFSSPDNSASVDVGPFHRCSAGVGRLNRAFRLGKREAGDFEKRWERARKFHGQRRELMTHFDKTKKERREAFKARRDSVRERLKERKVLDKKVERQDKKDMQDRRKAAKERFEKAREEIRKERGSRRERK